MARRAGEVLRKWRARRVAQGLPISARQIAVSFGCIRRARYVVPLEFAGAYEKMKFAVGSCEARRMIDEHVALRARRVA